MNNIHDHNQIEDTSEVRFWWRKTLLRYMREELPAEAQAGMAEFIDLIIKMASEEFVCKECLEKHRMTGMRAFIL